MNIEYCQIKRPYTFSSPYAGAEFAVLTYISDSTITSEEQALLSDQIVAAGCRYAVCAGYKCSSWDNSIDMADLNRNDWEAKEDNLVMTTWHENESLEDIAFFFLNTTSFGNFTAENLLVMVLGDDNSMLAEIRAEINKQLISFPK